MKGGGGEGVGVISGKKYLAEEKAFLQGNANTGKKYFSWLIMLENILHRCMSGKKFYHQRFRKTKFLPKPNYRYPSPPPNRKSNGRHLNKKLK